VNMKPVVLLMTAKYDDPLRDGQNLKFKSI